MPTTTTARHRNPRPPRKTKSRPKTPEEAFSDAIWWVSIDTEISSRVRKLLDGLDSSQPHTDAWLRFEPGDLDIVVTDGAAGFRIRVTNFECRGSVTDWVRLPLDAFRHCFCHSPAWLDTRPLRAFGFYEAGDKPNGEGPIEGPHLQTQLGGNRGRCAILADANPPADGRLAREGEPRIEAWCRLLDEARHAGGTGNDGLPMSPLDISRLLEWSKAITPNEGEPMTVALWVQPIRYDGEHAVFAACNYFGAFRFEAMFLPQGITRLVDGVMLSLSGHWIRFGPPEEEQTEAPASVNDSEPIEDVPHAAKPKHGRKASAPKAEGWGSLLAKIGAEFERPLVEIAISELAERDRMVVKLRYGLSGSAMKASEVGDLIDVTKEKVDQIERQALAALVDKCRYLQREGTGAPR